MLVLCSLSFTVHFYICTSVPVLNRPVKWLKSAHPLALLPSAWSGGGGRAVLAGGAAGKVLGQSTFWFEMKSWLHAHTELYSVRSQSQCFCFWCVDFQKRESGGSPEVLHAGPSTAGLS